MFGYNEGGNVEGSGYLVRGYEALVVAHYRSVIMFRWRAVLEPLYMFLYDEDFRV